MTAGPNNVVAVATANEIEIDIGGEMEYAGARCV